MGIIQENWQIIVVTCDVDKYNGANFISKDVTL